MRTTSIVAPDQKRSWTFIAAALGVILTIATTIALVDLPGEHLLSRGGSEGDGRVTAPALPQATWEMNVHAAGVEGRLTPAQKKAIENHRPELRSLVKRIYDSLFLHPNRLPDTLRENFSEPAAVALRRAGAGATDPGRVATTLRRANIGIQAAGARMAVASITVRALGEGTERPVLHRSALWLERARRDWKVVAFQVRQAPLREPTGKAPAHKKRVEGNRR